MLLSLTLKDYNPLALKGIKQITLTQIDYFNIIAGRNGYGKTSILRECSPMPPDNAKYGEHGYKRIEYQIDKDHYVLTSHTGKKSHHVFCRNGKNLNAGGTLTVQKELVKIHFGVTNDIKNVLMGLDKADLFTSLSPQRRKNVLMEINPNETEYALSVFEKLKRKHNNVKGALKHQRQRLASEIRRQEDLNLTPIDELEYEVSLLEDQIKDALLLYGELKDIDEPDLLGCQKKMAQLIAKMLESNEVISKDKEHWMQLKERYTDNLEEAHFRKKRVEEMFHKLTEQLNDASLDTDTNIDGYRLKIDTIKGIIADIQTDLNNVKTVLSQDAFFAQYETIPPSVIRMIPEVIEHIKNIDYIDDQTMTSSDFVALLEKEKQIKNKIIHTEERIAQFKHRLTHFYAVDEINCPQCQHGFKPGFESLSAEKLEASIADAEHYAGQLKEEESKIKETISIHEGWYYSMLSFFRYLKVTGEVDFFTAFAKHFSIGKGPCIRAVNLLNTVLSSVALEKALGEKEAEKTVLVTQYRLLNKDSIKSLYKELEELEFLLGEEQRKIKNYNKLLNECDKNLDLIHADELIRESYVACCEDIFSLMEEKGKYDFKKLVEARLNELTPRKNALTTKLIKSQSLVSVIDDIEKQVESLDHQERHLSFLIEKLSPTKGLIGHLMIDFLHVLCQNANRIIERVWSDPLILLPPTIDDENKDLDYKFQVVTTDKTRVILDIKECSGGEKEIIDFALRYTLMRFTKGRSGIPLCLDEIGASFDELHKRSYSNYIANEKAACRLPQAFMVSHFFTQYGSFNPKDINLVKLNTQGLTVPENGNEQVVMQ